MTCNLWLESIDIAGFTVYVPEIADYEVWRELLRTGATQGLLRLDRLKITTRYLPVTTEAMLLAAQMGASVRNAGLATADRHALDGDVILCAQALRLEIDPAEIVVATSNAAHIRRFLHAGNWQNITP